MLLDTPVHLSRQSRGDSSFPSSLPLPLQPSIQRVRLALAAASSAGQPSPLVLWGCRDRWLSREGVAELCRESGAELVELQEVGQGVGNAGLCPCVGHLPSQLCLWTRPVQVHSFELV